MYDNLKSLGITNPEEIDRYSLRQEANNDILKMIGRRHSYRQVEMAVENARTAGFDNISLDLIYGLPLSLIHI